jgi:UDP-N-acetylglucosamine--N-acetylmuramyl-(pentapeptide) pyrophosphoryl-undecaprenol N-acetylglucosamine transferase
MIDPQRPVMILAGGTGGHVFPALAVAEQLRRQGVPVVWLGTEAGLEARVVPAAGLPIEWLNVRGLRKRGVAGWLSSPWMIARATMQAVRAMRRHRPRAVLGMGGYVSGPGAAAAKLLGIPLLIHEQNAVPGFTNRKLLPAAVRVMTGFEGVFGEDGKIVHTGNPVRASIAAVPAPAERVRPEKPLHLLVLGGSQGAAALNEAVPAALARLDAKLRPQVWHQAGPRHLDGALAAYRQHAVEARVEPFIDDMAAAYAWADLAICRAGALTVAELAAAGVPAVLVPFPFAVDDHQTANARHLVARDAAVLFPQDHLTADRLSAVLAELLGDRAHLQTMAANARAMGRPDAAARVAQQCLEVAR